MPVWTDYTGYITLKHITAVLLIGVSKIHMIKGTAQGLFTQLTLSFHHAVASAVFLALHMLHQILLIPPYHIQMHCLKYSKAREHTHKAPCLFRVNYFSIDVVSATARQFNENV